jgi:multidrug efflux pump subunit AcrB
MMCAYLLKPERKKHGWLYRLFERGFDALLNVYEAGLKIVLRHRFTTLMVMLGTIALTGYLYVIIPKGFFPQQDTGLILGQSEAAQDISFQAMRERQQALQDAIVRDPAVESVGAAVGAGGGLSTLNDGRVFIQLKPHDQREPIQQVMARLRTSLAKIQGITLYMQAAQDITIGARLNKTQFQFTLNDADPGELNHWAGLSPGIRSVTEEHADPHRRVALRHLSHPRHALRELDPPDHHHLNFAVCRRWGAVDADGSSLRSERDRDRRHHSADRDRQEKRHHAGRFCSTS